MCAVIIFLEENQESNDEQNEPKPSEDEIAKQNAFVQKWVLTKDISR